jgi:P27 family predicted phage terminase small subunit
MKGRKALPTAVKLLAGNPGHRSKADLGRGEPNPDVALGEPPDDLNDVGRAYWFKEGGHLLKTRVITEADHNAFAALCYFHQRKHRCIQLLNSLDRKARPTKKEIWQMQVAQGQLMKLEAAMHKMRLEFGMTPASRTRVRVDDGQGELPLGAELSPLARATQMARSA